MSFVKVLVVGDTATGKTSLVSRVTENTFPERYKATIGCEFGFTVIKVAQQNVRVQLWDLAGQDRLGGMSKLYCRNADGALVVADLAREETVAQAQKWKRQIDEYVRLPSGQSIPMVLCLNKCDLVSITADAFALHVAEAKAQEFAGCMQTSAKTGFNVKDALVELLGEVSPLCKPESQQSTALKLNGSVQRPDKCRC